MTGCVIVSSRPTQPICLSFHLEQNLPRPALPVHCHHLDTHTPYSRHAAELSICNAYCQLHAVSSLDCNDTNSLSLISFVHAWALPCNLVYLVWLIALCVVSRHHTVPMQLVPLPRPNLHMRSQPPQVPTPMQQLTLALAQTLMLRQLITST